MLCAGTGWEDDTDFLEKFRAKLISQRVPLSVSIALTDRCNLHCVHCYLNPKRAREGYHLNELSTDRFLTILDDITELGCLFLLFTGGEALLRRDFAVLYRRAKMNGMVVTVFTNGTTVTEEIADLFAELPPYWVEVSVYGASERTYQSITGDSSAYRRCLSGIERLVKRNVRVQVKTILMKLNVHEFEQIEEMAKGFSARFRFDGVIGTDSEGGKQPLQFRASPRDIAVKEVRTLELREEWKGIVDKSQRVSDPRLMYNCAAGRNLFHITADGFMQPCIMSPTPAFDVRTRDVKDVWASAMPQMRRIPAPENYACNHCDLRTVCSFCPPAFLAESGYNPPEFHCALSRERLQALKATDGGVE